jgi:NADH dehydrogenase
MGSSAYPKLRIGIVGGGATGVELAAEIHHTICTLRNYGANLFQEQLEMTIMEGGPRILGGGHQALSTFAKKELEKRKIEVRTNCFIKSVTEEGFEFTDGGKLVKDIKIWTAGIKAPDWLSTLGLKVNQFNQIIVNENLQTEDEPSIFALGDCAATPAPKIVDPKVKKPPPSLFLPATAQVAHQQAEWLAQKVEAKLTNKHCNPFLFKPQGMLVSLGEGKAVGSLAAIVGPKRDYYVQGRGAKALYSSLYRMHQAVLYGWTRAALLFIGDKLRHVALPQLKLH